MNGNPAREEAIFADALAQPPAERSAFPAKACGEDYALLGRLIALIAAHASKDSLIASAPVCAASVQEEKAGDLIGHYKLLQKPGEGGCGVVWMAEREEPVRRRVALKIIKLVMGTDPDHEVLRRKSSDADWPVKRSRKRRLEENDERWNTNRRTSLC